MSARQPPQVFATHRRLGQILLETVPLTPHDVEDVLSEQRHSPATPFGHIAIDLGLCTPQHLWLAFAHQLEAGPLPIDIDSVGIDAQALYVLPGHLAVEYQALPIRLVSNHLVIATTPEHLARAQAELPARLPFTLRFAFADPSDLARALELCYVPTPLH